MKFWRRRRPLHIPAELIRADERRPSPSEVVYEFLNASLAQPGKAKAVKPAWLESERIRD